MFKTVTKSKSRRSSQIDQTNFPTARAQLLTAAKTLFAHRGLSGTSIRDIAQHAGVNSSLISYYFAGKDGLYRACLQEIGEGRWQRAREILQTPRTKEEFSLRLQLWIENIFELYLADRDAGLILVREFDRLQSPAQEVFRQTFLKIFELMIDFFRAAQTAGFIARDRDAFVLASLLFGMVVSEMRFDHLRERAYRRSLHDAGERKKIEEHIVALF
jgi:AcrR family transcriptional regulator